MRQIAIALVAAAILGPACAATGSPLSPSATNTGSTEPVAATPSVVTPSSSSDLQYCADITNRYRASVGLRPLVRSASLEDFAAQAASYRSQHMPAGRCRTSPPTSRCHALWPGEHTPSKCCREGSCPLACGARPFYKPRLTGPVGEG